MSLSVTTAAASSQSRGNHVRRRATHGIAVVHGDVDERDTDLAHLAHLCIHYCLAHLVTGIDRQARPQAGIEFDGLDACEDGERRERSAAHTLPFEGTCLTRVARLFITLVSCARPAQHQLAIQVRPHEPCTAALAVSHCSGAFVLCAFEETHLIDNRVSVSRRAKQTPTPEL